uniref:Plant heme peroxidase family profile domain-containing protein n=1 Tax=Ananas comosus var. bracteatus TaxID=296719 RepID=A0A6V7PKC8_ANACO|nr:unnamed protein product [Ananas comosus var. bracteatus]
MAAAAAGERRVLHCDGCGASEFDGGDDGFYYCRHCGSQSQDVVDTGCADEDVVGDGSGRGALYSFFHHRSRPSAAAAAAAATPSAPKLSREDLLRSLARSVASMKSDDEEGEERGGKGEGERPYAFEEEEGEEPRDFGAGPGPGADAEAAGAAIRARYVQGLQVMLQRQCEALVEQFGVGPLICGLAGTIWLRYVAASQVLDEGWARKVITESKAAAAATPSRDDKQVLPTDIYQWAIEGKLPYLTAFVELDKYLGTPSSDCPLSTRFLFRPIRVVGPWQLEETAASISQTIGLRLPSVNFYAIARRYLHELSLPVEKILQHACRLYEWSLPAELWLSSNASRLPTRVCVMSILIVTLRILYNIHGQGTWEMGLSDIADSLSCGHQFEENVDESNSSSRQKLGVADQGSRACQSTTNSSTVKNLMDNKTSEFETKELLSILEAAYGKINVRHDYAKDLPSYLKYCKDVAFTGITTSYDEETLIERLWDIYSKKEDDNQQDDVKAEFSCLKGKRSSNEAPATEFFDLKRPHKNSSGRLTCSKSFAIERMKQEMEENGFHYLPPRAQKRTEGYLHYKRKKVDGRLIYVAHADYYILLRSFAKLAQVDVRIMHLGVLKLERRLGWTELRIDSSLNALPDLPGATFLTEAHVYDSDTAILSLAEADGVLSPYYYQESCSLAEEIVRHTVEGALYQDPRIAAGLLRLHFHDCFVLGCDASVLLDDADGFEVIDFIKALLEEACPLTVSCADILAIAARDAVHLRGGPTWEVYLGRKDSLKAASISTTNQMIPAPNSSLEMLISNFKDHGLDIVDLVSLSGSHTIGRSRCVSFKDRIYGLPSNEEYDERRSIFFHILRSICPESGGDDKVVPLDSRTSRRFDNLYYINLLRGEGLLHSDNALASEEDAEESVLSLVWAYAEDQELFFQHYTESIIKMGNINVLTGVEGEVRHNCRFVNSFYH